MLLKIPQDLNDFSYALNNPVNLSDPYGLAPCDDYHSKLCRANCAAQGKSYKGCSQHCLGAICTGTCTCGDDLDDDHEHCMRLYLLCVQDGWKGECGMCLRNCKVQGEWPFYMCYPCSSK